LIFKTNAGWAYDLKTVSDSMVKRRVLRTGDGTHRYSKEEAEKVTAKELVDIYNNNKNTTILKKTNPHELQTRFADTFWGFGKMNFKLLKQSIK
jgi:hypothetical protein